VKVSARVFTRTPNVVPDPVLREFEMVVSLVFAPESVTETAAPEIPATSRYVPETFLT